jgi:hypothetical protein
LGVLGSIGSRVAVSGATTIQGQICHRNNSVIYAVANRFRSCKDTTFSTTAKIIFHRRCLFAYKMPSAAFLFLWVGFARQGTKNRKSGLFCGNFRFFSLVGVSPHLVGSVYHLNDYFSVAHLLYIVGFDIALFQPLQQLYFFLSVKFQFHFNTIFYYF